MKERVIFYSDPHALTGQSNCREFTYYVGFILNGVGTNFGVGVGEARPEGPRAGDVVLGEGTASPSPPA